MPVTDARPRVAPDSQTIVLALPGMTLNGTIMPEFPHELIAVDFCQFTPQVADRDITMDTYAAELDAVLAREARWRRPRRVVVGHSFGGMLALHWLATRSGSNPGAVEGVVLIAASAGPFFDVVRLLTLGRRLPLKPWMPLWNLVTVTRAAKAVFSPSRSEEGRVDFRALDRYTDAAVDRAGWRNTNWRSMRAFRLALDGFDCRMRLPSFPYRTIVLHGDRDSLFPTDVADDLVALLPHAELRIVPGAAHALPLTHGEHVRQAVDDILRG
jgi:pimeloyl-ACP methyl ester carboxylesterase